MEGNASNQTAEEEEKKCSSQTYYNVNISRNNELHNAQMQSMRALHYGRLQRTQLELP